MHIAAAILITLTAILTPTAPDNNCTITPETTTCNPTPTTNPAAQCSILAGTYTCTPTTP